MLKSLFTVFIPVLLVVGAINIVVKTYHKSIASCKAQVSAEALSNFQLLCLSESYTQEESSYCMSATQASALSFLKYKRATDPDSKAGHIYSTYTQDTASCSKL